MGIIATKGFQFRGVPKSLINYFCNEKIFNRFLETGTYLGHTAFWAKKHFPEVYTIEANEQFFLNYPVDTEINFILGDSGILLENYISNDIVIYLDAHYSGGTTHNSYPLMRELDLINKVNPQNALIIIDDARFCLAKWNDEKYGNLTDIVELLSFGRTRHVLCFDDMIIACDAADGYLLENYTNMESKKYWNVFLSENAVDLDKRRIGVLKKLLRHLRHSFRLN